jgi:hypothetical protein
MIRINKRDLTIEKQLPRWIMKYSKYLAYTPFLLATQIVNTFLNSRISAKHDEEE